ncbi:haloacid dehalogenase type II [Chelativorans sp. AA-79]|uniref:haloacid dehalogenase type II n=1 Tax=Chelativorans sp. AA-79 TaxID=3028735 RepID=UPI0023F71EE3|nr:haloacid dehalogenase type II [Chelativorans sp. AA-79]WEX07762.1 haloacid dehalogenase type II [Chelativorans sp. AA-79]
MRFSAFVFDAYGTLFDVHSAVRRHAAEIGPEGQVLSEVWRAKQLEYSWVGTLMDEHADFWTLTERALDFAFRKVPAANPAVKQKLLDAYWHLDCYPEVPGVLSALKAGGARLSILSNGSRAMIEAALRSSALDTMVDDVLSADMAGKFKTHPAVYELATTALRAYPDTISFQSSNRWDIAGATRYGFRTVWINRSNQPDEYLEQPPQLILPSLEGLLTAR